MTANWHDVADATGHPHAERIVTLGLPDWVNVIARTADDHIVMVRLHRFGIDAPSLEIPGGIIDPGESPREAAIRELREETGFVADAVESAGFCHPNPAMQSNRVHTFVADRCARVGPQQLDEMEDCAVELVHIGELERCLERGEITHALVRVAIAEYLLRDRSKR